MITWLRVQILLQMMRKNNSEKPVQVDVIVVVVVIVDVVVGVGDGVERQHHERQEVEAVEPEVADTAAGTTAPEDPVRLQVTEIGIGTEAGHRVDRKSRPKIGDRVRDSLGQDEVHLPVQSHRDVIGHLG